MQRLKSIFGYKQNLGDTVPAAKDESSSELKESDRQLMNYPQKLSADDQQPDSDGKSGQDSSAVAHDSLKSVNGTINQPVPTFQTIDNYHQLLSFYDINKFQQPNKEQDITALFPTDAFRSYMQVQGDCLSCKVIGVSTCYSLSALVIYSIHKGIPNIYTLRKIGNAYAALGLSFAFFTIGTCRLFDISLLGNKEFWQSAAVEMNDRFKDTTSQSKSPKSKDD